MHNYLKFPMLDCTALSPECVFDPQWKEAVQIWFGLGIWKTKCVWKGDFFACESLNWTWTSHGGFAVLGLHSHSDHWHRLGALLPSWPKSWCLQYWELWKHGSQSFYPGKIRHVSPAGVDYLLITSFTGPRPCAHPGCTCVPWPCSVLSMWNCAL